MNGYAEFELNVPAALADQLLTLFEALTPAPLIPETVAALPDVQGAYTLSYLGALVYVGKTDAQAGFRERLTRHYHSVQHRWNLDPTQVGFKAVRIMVFNSFDVEALLIDAYARMSGVRPSWNFSGFGANDPGRQREDTRSSQFNLGFPINIDIPLNLIAPGQYAPIDLLRLLKERLPYVLRYQTDKDPNRNTPGRWRQGHSEHADGVVQVNQPGMTMREIMVTVCGTLPPGWQATLFPERVILYKENRSYVAGQVICHSPT